MLCEWWRFWGKNIRLFPRSIYGNHCWDTAGMHILSGAPSDRSWDDYAVLVKGQDYTGELVVTVSAQ